MRIRKYDYLTKIATTEQEVTGGIHPYHEILFITSGEMMLEWMGNIYNVRAPALFLITPNTPHKLSFTSLRSSFGFLELDLQPTDFFPALDKVMVWNELQCGAKRDAQSFMLIYHHAQQLWDTLSSSKHSKWIRTEIAVLDTKKIFLLIYGFLENEASGDEVKPSSEDMVHFLMRFMESVYYENITMSTLTAYVHLNRSYLIRLFRRVTGMSPLGYLQELRMKAATSYLSTTTMTVQQIGEAVGYQSIHYFSRLFKQKYGKSPTQWRSEQRNETYTQG